VSALPEKMLHPNSVGFGDDIYMLIERLYPICRSITGEGLRETLRIVSEVIPLEIHEVATGTKVFDWEVPREWAIRDAYIEDANGQRIIDFLESNLHVVNYSCTVDATLPLSELREHLHTDPDHPDWIPYRTCYYNEDWGFCLSQNQLDSLADGTYRAIIDADLFQGALSYGEYCIPGRSADEILLFAHCCHPSLCNDNLSGVAMLAVLAKQLSEEQLHHTIPLSIVPPDTFSNTRFLNSRCWTSVLGDTMSVSFVRPVLTCHSGA
jgi:aminopeptidase-like protein